jgi:hypothetical protein
VGVIADAYYGDPVYAAAFANVRRLAGGETAFTRLINAFYDRVEAMTRSRDWSQAA